MHSLYATTEMKHERERPNVFKIRLRTERIDCEDIVQSEVAGIEDSIAKDLQLEFRRASCCFSYVDDGVVVSEFLAYH